MRLEFEHLPNGTWVCRLLFPEGGFIKGVGRTKEQAQFEAQKLLYMMEIP